MKPNPMALRKGYGLATEIEARALSPWVCVCLVLLVSFFAISPMFVVPVLEGRSFSLLLRSVSVGLVLCGFLILLSGGSCWFFRDYYFFFPPRPTLPLPQRCGVADAPEQSWVLVEGRAVVREGRKIVAPISEREGVYSVLEINVAGGNAWMSRRWNVLHQSQQSVPFLLEDGSGATLALNPEIMLVDVDRSKSTLAKEVFPRDEELPEEVVPLFRGKGWKPYEIRRIPCLRVYETVIGEGDPVAVFAKLKRVEAGPYRGESGGARYVAEEPAVVFGGTADELRRWLDDERKVRVVLGRFALSGLALLVAGLVLRFW